MHYNDMRQSLDDEESQALDAMIESCIGRDGFSVFKAMGILMLHTIEQSLAETDNHPDVIALVRAFGETCQRIALAAEQTDGETH